MRFASLGSGSKGNATLISDGETVVLVDCGFTRKEFELRLAQRQILPSELSAILVTHEHSDHASGVAVLARAYGIPVYATHGTFMTGKLDGIPASRPFNAGDEFAINNLKVKSIAVPHDAREPVQYVFESGEKSLGVLTDLGMVTPHIIDAFSACRALILEFNHDLEMLLNGPYPQALKRRVAGDFGHLNNNQSTEFLLRAEMPVLEQLVVAHISEQNNSVAHAQSAISPFTERYGGKVHYACQQEGFDWLSLS